MQRPIKRKVSHHQAGASEPLNDHGFLWRYDILVSTWTASATRWAQTQKVNTQRRRPGLHLLEILELQHQLQATQIPFGLTRSRPPRRIQVPTQPEAQTHT